MVGSTAMFKPWASPIWPQPISAMVIGLPSASPASFVQPRPLKPPPSPLPQRERSSARPRRWPAERCPRRSDLRTSSAACHARHRRCWTPKTLERKRMRRATVAPWPAAVDFRAPLPLRRASPCTRAPGCTQPRWRRRAPGARRWRSSPPQGLRRELARKLARAAQLGPCSREGHGEGTPLAL